MDSQNTTGKDPARGRVRHLKGFRVEVNGRVYARLAANKTNITLKKCKSAMKYTCVVVVMTCPDKSDVHQRKVRIKRFYTITNYLLSNGVFLSTKRGGRMAEA